MSTHGLASGLYAVIQRSFGRPAQLGRHQSRPASVNLHAEDARGGLGSVTALGGGRGLGRSYLLGPHAARDSALTVANADVRILIVVLW